MEPYKNKKLERRKFGKWLSDVSIDGDWLITGGGPAPSMWHLRAMAPTVIPELPDHCSAVFVTKLVKSEDRVVFGGQFGGNLVYHYNLNGQLMAEIKTESSCIYSVESTVQKDFKLMSLGGASNKMTLCTHNFSYPDNSVSFP